jgi:hypothetical protein
MFGMAHSFDGVVFIRFLLGLANPILTITLDYLVR